MAAVVGLNGRGETFPIVNYMPSKDDEPSNVLLHVNKLASSKNSCRSGKTCDLTDNDSSKFTADVVPDPGYVIKATASGSGIKVFVNVCKRGCVEKPSSAKQVAHGGRFGLSWTIPHTVNEQVINGSKCKQAYRVFDFQVHPDTCRMAETNSRFKNMLNELAVGAVAGEFNVHLNARKLQFPKIKYKGLQAVSRKNAQLSQASSEATTEVPDKPHSSSVEQTIRFPVDSSSSESEITDHGKTNTNSVTAVDLDSNNNKFTVPKYSLTFAASKEVPVVNGVTFLQVLVADVELPSVKSASAITLNVSEKSVNLTSAGAEQYKLDIDLPCTVDENHSFAKFVKSKRVLHITMPVLTSSNPCALSAETTPASDVVGLLDAKSDSSTESVSSCSVEVTPGQNADLILSANDEFPADESVNCLTNVNSQSLLQFSHRQDLETVSLVFSVNDVVPNSMVVSFLSDSLCKIETDQEAGDVEVPSHMCCFVKFDDDCQCKDGSYTVNVTDVGLLLDITKASQCHYMWDTFWTGTDINHLEKRQFLTSACLKSDTDSWDVEHCEKDSEDKSPPAVLVESLDDDITVEEPTKSNEDGSSEIVVVHEKGVPKLHGILKQRTVSESSDDGARSLCCGCERQVSTTTGSEGDDNEDSPDTSTVSGLSSGRQLLRKSVSFNDYIDRTLFQANQSVSSMHAALKNRRRRARKRDQKQEQREQRRRCRSSGSFSLEESGDEQTTGTQTADLSLKRDSENSLASGESKAQDCSSSAHVSREKVDSSSFMEFSNGTEITDEKTFSSRHVPGSESSSVNGNVYENAKPVHSQLQQNSFALNDTISNSFNQSDVVRTNSRVEDCDSKMVNDNACNATDIFDNKSSVDVVSEDENSEHVMSSVHIADAGDGMVEEPAEDDVHPSLAACCRPSSFVEILKSSHTDDNTVSVAESKSQVSPEKIAAFCVFSVPDLDVD